MTAATVDRVRTKRVYNAPLANVGRRILITRYWPRGVPKSAAHEYDTKVAPSRELVRQFRHEDLGWVEYTRRFLAEMAEEPALSEIKRFAEIAAKKPITLLCMCEDEARCHRSLVAELVREAMKGAE